MPPPRVRQIDPPRESRLAPRYAGANLADAYAVALPAEATHDIAALAKAVLAHPAPWQRALLGVRDATMARFGVKTSREVGRDARGSGAVGFFPVLERAADELILGAPDRHLDFWVSVLRRPAPAGRAGPELVVTTVVACHNTLGRAYLSVILPLHRRAVRSMLSRAARRSWPEAGEGPAVR